MKRLKIIFIFTAIILLYIPIMSEDEFKILDNMDDVSNWQGEGEQTATLKLSSSQGKENKCIVAEYDFKDYTWTQIWRGINIDFTKLNVIRFYIKGTGKNNNLELKLVDADGTNYGIKFDNYTVHKEWEQKKIYLDEFKYYWGGDKDLDLKNITTLYFAITKSEGGSGKVYLDQLEYALKSSTGPEDKIVVTGAGKYLMLDNADRPGKWMSGGEDDATISLSAASGKKGKCVKVDYDFKGKTWVYFLREMKLDLTGIKKIKYWYKGEGNNNNLEVKFKDLDGSIFGVRLSNATLTPDWELKEISFDEFEYFWGGDDKLDLKNIVSFEIAITKGAGGSGTFYIDEIMYTGTFKELLTGVTEKSLKVTVDNFERIDPYKIYLPRAGDNSEIKLFSSRESYNGLLCMEIKYTLETPRSTPTWAACQWIGDKKLDWSGAKELSIAVRGDGSDNKFVIQLIESNGEVWEIEDLDILKSNQWSILKYKFADFTAPLGTLQIKEILNLDDIKGIRFLIRGKDAATTHGFIYLDDLKIFGQDLIPAFASFPKVLTTEVKPVELIGNVLLRGLANTEYKQSNKYGNVITEYSELVADAKVSKFGFFFKFGINPFNYSNSIHIHENGYHTEFSNRLHPRESYIYANNVTDFMRSIRLGDIWSEYSDYTYTPFHSRSGGVRYKGLSLDGKFGLSDYQFFLAKKYSESFILGLKLTQYLFNTNFNWIYIDNMIKARNNAAIENGILSDDAQYTSNLVEQDITFTFDFKSNILDNLIVSGLAGYNKFNRVGEANLYDTSIFTYRNKLDTEINSSGLALKVGVELKDIPIKGLVLHLDYYNFDTQFRPIYRRDPEYFDDFRTDIHGVNSRLYYYFRQFIFSCDYGYYKRKVDVDKYYLKRLRYGIEYRNWSGLELALWSESIRNYYKIETLKLGPFGSNERIDKNQDENIIQGEIVYNFSPKMKLRERIEYKLVTDHGQDKENIYTTFYTKFDYFYNNNTKLLIEYDYKRYNNPDDENIFKAKLEINF